MKYKKGVLYVLIANFINLSISLFTGFLLPKFLSVDSYANIKIFQMYITYIGVLHFGFSDGMYLKYGGKNIKNLNISEISSEYKTFKYFQIIITLICVFISILLKNKILFFCSIVILPINIGNYIRNLYQATGNFKLYSRYMNINTIMIFIINMLILFIIKSDNYNLYIICYCISYFLYCFFVEYELKKMIGYKKTSIKKIYLIENVKNGFLLMLGNFANVIFTTIDRVFVKFILGLVQFAYYSFAVSIENILNTFITPISTVMYNYLCINKSIDKIKLIKKLIYIISSILVLFLFPCKFIILNYIPKYSMAVNILIFLITAQYVSVIIKTIHINLYKVNKMQNKYFLIMMYIIFLSIILNIILYILLKNSLSFAIATFITYLIWYIINEIKLKQYASDVKDYLFFGTIILLFVSCSIFFNWLIGFLIYLFIASLLILLFEKEALIFLINEFKKMLKTRKKV